MQSAANKPRQRRKEAADPDTDREIAEHLQGTYNWLKWTGQLAARHAELDREDTSGTSA